MPKKLYPLLCWLLAMIISGCNSSLPSVPQLPKLAVYKIDVAQGNIIDADQLARLAVGMPKQHVRVLLGTPLIQDPFHPERWDYIYNLQPGGEARQQRQISLFFNDQDELDRLEGDISGQLRQTPLQITRTKTTVNVPALAKTEDVGFWRGLRRRLPFSGDKPIDKPVQTVAVEAPEPIAPASIAQVNSESEKPGFLAGIWQRLPFVGNKKDSDNVDTAEAIASVSPPGESALTRAVQQTKIVPETLPADTATAINNQVESVDISVTAPSLAPGMSLSEINPADNPTEQLPEEEIDDFDNRPGLFDGLLRKIGG